MGQFGVGAALDYRGNEVFAAWQHLSSLNWGLVVKIDADESDRVLVEASKKIVAIMLAIILLAALASVLVSQAFVVPLLELREAAEQISKGDIDIRLRVDSDDEIGELAESFERMVAAIKFYRESRPDGEELDA